jgi:hypothetical protein
MAVESISKKSNKGCENGDAYKVCLASKEGDESELLDAWEDHQIAEGEDATCLN